MRDERQSRPSTLKEMNAQRGYSPFKCIYNRSDGTQCEWNIACYLSCECCSTISKKLKRN